MNRILAGFLVVALSACTNGATPDATTTPDTTPIAQLSTTTLTTATTEVNQEPLIERLNEVVDLLNGATMDEAQFQASFSADFINAISHAEFVSLIDQLRTLGDDWAIVEFEERDDFSATVLVAPAAGDAVRLQMALENASPYRISGLFVQPAEEPSLENPPTDFASGLAELQEHGTVALLAAEVVEGQCQPFEELAVDSPAPLGSAFKLYVLGAVADAVAAGTLAWDDDVEVQDDLKSIPSGILQNEEAGTTFSLREMAELMISISDNTATDHLIDLVGREAVEQAFVDGGMADPSLNIPLMDTLDLAALKVGPASGLATQWIDAEGDAEARRALLAQISDISPSDIPVAEFVEPVHPDQIEWFGTPEDLCRAMVWLGEKGEPTTQILSISPGVPDSNDLFEEIWFKGGSEPGLTTMVWMVTRPDGRQFFLFGSVLNPTTPLPEPTVTLLLTALRDFLAEA